MIYDYVCPKCGATREHLFHTLQQRDHTAVCCRNCCVPMMRQTSSPAFKVKGYNAGNGYSVDGTVERVQRTK